MREFIYCRISDNGNGITASVVPADRKADQTPQFGTGETIETAIGRAMRRPGVRFRANGDELQAEIAAFRDLPISVMIRNDEMTTLGFR